MSTHQGVLLTPALLFIIMMGLSEDHKVIAGGFPFTAMLNVSYIDPVSGEQKNEEEELGLYASDSSLDDVWGVLVHVQTQDGSHYGCSPPINPPSHGERWVALIKRGECRFHQKIFNVAVDMNASAVIVYNNDYSQLLSMKHKVEDVVSVFIRKEAGDKIALLIDNGTRVTVHISRSEVHIASYDLYNNMNRSSVLFVSVSFIILMIISLSWLVFYYVQRVRYARNKDHLSRHLINSAKKAVNRMEQRTLSRNDPELDSELEMCAICVESYRTSEIVRVLPCRHVFHKLCVDPWLIERRTCPICKLDILKSTGSKNSNPRVVENREIARSNQLDSSALLLHAGEDLTPSGLEEGVEREGGSCPVT